METSGSISLTDKTVIVTGGGKGIGAAYSRGLAAAGARVVIADIDAAAARAVAEEIGPSAVSLAVDIGDAASCEDLARRSAAAWGGIDALVNNAALFAVLRRQPWSDIDPAEFDRVLHVNVTGTWLMCRAVAPYMRRRGQGRIVNVSSSSVVAATNHMAHYVASKSAVIGLTRALARELGADNICVNALLPGVTATETNAETTPAEMHRGQVGQRCIQRIESPEDLVGTLCFLCSDAIGFMTGQSLLVDGGRHFL